jgi:menaquinone-dependent protoporphyrinogen IX oxidase
MGAPPMKAIVLYRSISGFTRKYAQWIAEDLGADLHDCRKVKLSALAGYDLVVFGGSLRAGGINGIDIIKRNFAALAGKRIIIFATGGSSAREGIAEEILAANFSAEQGKQLRLFYFRGGFDIGKLGILDKVLMAQRKRKLLTKRREDLGPDEKVFLAAYENPADGTEKESIRSLVDYARS